MVVTTPCTIWRSRLLGRLVGHFFWTLPTNPRPASDSIGRTPVILATQSVPRSMQRVGKFEGLRIAHIFTPGRVLTQCLTLTSMGGYKPREPTMRLRQ